MYYDNDYFDNNYYDNNYCAYYDEDYCNYVKMQTGDILKKLFKIEKNPIIITLPIYEKFLEGNRKKEVLRYRKVGLISPQIFNIVYVYLVYIAKYDKEFVINKMSYFVNDYKNKYKKKCELEKDKIQEINKHINSKQYEVYWTEEEQRQAREERIRNMLNEDNTF